MVDDFDAWYAELRPAMAPALAAWCGDASIATDALDEAFTRSFEHWERVRRADSPAGWVWRTAVNVVRRRYRRRTMEHDLLRRADAPAGAVDPNVDEDLDLRAALLRLTERQRTAIVLHHIADRPHAEIALVLGIATGTVAATLHQARARLAAELGAPIPTDAAAPTDGATP
jgi:RNA polymerase sigma-70 factor (ECF subfamily)